MPRQPILSVLGHVDSGKCVAPDTEIQLADGSTVKARKLFENYKEDGERLENEEGEVYELDDGPQVVGVREGEVEDCRVQNICKLEKDKLLHFKLKDGSEIKVTPEHPFLTVESNELAFKDAEDFDGHEMVAVPERIPKKDSSIESLKSDTLEVLSEDERILCFVEEGFSNTLREKGRTVEEELLTNHLCDCQRNNRYRAQDIVKICGEADISLEKAYDKIEELKQSTLKRRAGSTSKRMELPSNMDEFEDLAYTVGMMLGDGNREATVLYNNSQHLRQEFTAKLENSTGLSTQVSVYEEKVDEIYISCGKTLSKFFEILFDFPLERKSHSIKLSDYALKMPKNVLANLISGYFDADGYVNKKGTVEITSASKEMIESLKTTLKQFGISAYTSRNRDYYELYISGKENLQNFSKIGFKHPEKKERFQKNLENSVKNPVTGQTPVSGKEIRKARRELGASHTELEIPHQKRYEEYNGVSKSYLEKFVEEYRRIKEDPDFKLNKEQKTRILKKLDQKSETRAKIYEKEDIEHPRLLNHLLSLESEGFIDRASEEIKITEKGQEILEKWNKDEEKVIRELEKIANSDLRFVEIESIEEKEGGTVYDFTTGANTFIAEDIVVHNTTLLDSIRESKIVEGEAGGITQMIGATEVPLETVKDTCGGLLDQLDTDLTIPGLLFIDTPGHAAFSSLRKRGGSISDIAILVVDINQGIQPQTREAIEILKDSGTPFVIALNKIDTLHGWKQGERLFTKSIQKQNERNQNAVDNEIYELMGDLDDYDIVADRFDRVEDFKQKVAIAPISAKTGEGVPELLMVVAGLSQNYLADELEFHEGIGKGTVLEVSQEQGLGTTIDVIHYDGVMKKTDKLVYGTASGVKTTDIRALLEPQPLKEIRVDKQYQQVDELRPASGVKIAGKDLEGVIAGAPIRTATEENLDQAIEEVEEELESVDFETQKHGVVVKADSLGSLEAVMREIEEEDINVKKAEVGPITKSDVIEVENEDPSERAILSFNTGLTEQGARAVRDKGIEVFESEVIYEIVDNYIEWKEELQEQQRKNALNAISRPAKIRSMPDHVFNQAKPAVVGVKVTNGVLTPGSSIMTLDGDVIGKVKSVQAENETLSKAERGQEVAVSISNATVGRDFEEGDELIVNITGKEYQQLKELEDLLSEGEKQVLEEIVDIKDEQDPHWKIG